MLKVTKVSKCVILRSLSTTCGVNGSNKEWLAMQRQKKAKKDRVWAKREFADPFSGNIGVRHQLKAFGLRDPSDPVVSNKLAYSELGYEDEVSGRLEETVSATTKYQKELHGYKKLRPDISREALRRILTKKNFFPDPKSPNLLTFMEKETMKSLHAQDPVEWSIQRLSECFPATPYIVKKVLRNRSGLPPSMVEGHDQDVAKNWRQLLEGDIQVSDELMNHLVENFEKISSGVHSYMSDSAHKQLVVSIQQKLSKTNEPAKREVKGPFGQIITDYKRKVELIRLKDKEPQNEVKRETEVVVPEGVLTPEPEFWVDIPTPYGETTMIKSGIDYKRERAMTMEEFKKRFLDSKMNKQKKWRQNENGQTYFDWLKDENARDDFSKKNPVQVLSEKEIGDEVESARKDRFFQLPKKYLQQKSNPDNEESAEVHDLSNLCKKDYNKSEINLKVDIPESEYKSGALYKLNNCYYDSSGEFLYRCPS